MSQMIECQIVVLAAGNGSRMKSELPKVLHQIYGKPMIDFVLESAFNVTSDVVLVHSKFLEDYIKNYKFPCKLILQEHPLGTAHAVYCALSVLRKDVLIAVIYADNPFISSSIIEEMVHYLNSTNSATTTLAFECNDPNQYGRLVTDVNNNIIKIVEYKYANEDELKITLCNSGIMTFAPNILQQYLHYCIDFEKPITKEFYLTTMIEVCNQHNLHASYLLSKSKESVIGVNTQEELFNAKNIFNTMNNNS